MAVFLFLKDIQENSLYRVADNIEEVNYYNVNLSSYTVITENNSTNYLNFILGITSAIGYNNNIITYINNDFTKPVYENKIDLDNYIKFYSDLIKTFLKNNPNNPLFTKWNNYNNQLLSFNTNSLIYPFFNTLEQHFYNNNLPILNPLQLP
jgi:hypothetical protein